MQRVRLRSRDYFWYSPVLNKQLHGKTADIVGDAPQRGGRDPRRARRARKLPHPADRRAAPRPATTGRPCRSKAACCSTSPNMTEGRVAEAAAILRCEPGVKMNDLDAADPPDRLGAAHASLHQAHGDHRRLRRRRLGRHRLGQLRRPARAGQHPRRARRHAARKPRA